MIPRSAALGLTAATLAATVVVGTAGPVSAAHPLPGAPVQVSPDSGWQEEPSIAVNPKDPSNLVAGYIDDFHCGVAHSSDGGATWTRAVLPESTDQAFTLAGDPVVEFTDTGTAYFLCMNTALNNAVKTQYVYRSDDGGQSWSTPVLAISPAWADHDKGSLVADNHPTSPHYGNVYVGATNLLTGDLLFARSTDGAGSFSAPLTVNDADIGFAVSLAVGADGAVYAAWSVEQPAPGGGTNTVAVRVDRSDDGGQTFGALSGGADVDIQTGGIVKGGVRGEPGRGNGAPYIATSPTDPYQVYAVWAEKGPGADDSDIHFARSTDRGQTWSASVRLNTDVNPAGDFSSQFWPSMSVDPTDGSLNVIWYSDENDPDRTDGTPQIDLLVTESTDGGITWSSPARVTPSRSQPTGFFGDYLGIDAYGGVAHPIWVDTTLGTGTLDVATTQIGAADLSITKTDSPDPAVAGSTLTYGLTVGNAGPAAARDVVVTDTLPAGVSFVSSDAGCTATSGTVTCTLAQLAAGSSASIHLTVSIDPALVHDAQAEVHLTNTASVTSSQPDAVTTDNTSSQVTTVRAQSDLAAESLLVTGATTDPVVGATTTRTLTAQVTNSGPSTPTDATVTFGAATGPGLTVSVAPTSTLLAAVGTGPAREATATATVTCTAPGTHQLTVHAQVAPHDPATTDPVPSNDVAEQTVDIDCLVPVAVNIKPGSLDNPVRATTGEVPVAVLTTAAGEYGLPLAVDATAIDIPTVRFASAAALQAGGGAPESHGIGHPQDALELDERTRDGDIDTVLHFDPVDAGITGSSNLLCVRGTLEFSGSPYGFIGCDTVHPVGRW